MSEQFSLFYDDQQAASLASVMRLVRAAMNRVADQQEGGVSRDHIADQLSSLADFAGISLTKRKTNQVSKHVLDKWLNPSAIEHAPSLEAVVAYCMVTGDPSPLRPILQALGCDIMTERQRALCNYAEAILEEKRVQISKKELEAKLL